MQGNTIFRKVALDRLASPEQLDSLMTVTRPTGWLALIGAALVIAAALLWAWTGSIPTKVAGEGILISGGGVHQMVPLAGGHLTDVRIEEGDTVARGQVIARVAQPQLAAEVERIFEEVEALRGRVAQAAQGAEAVPSDPTSLGAAVDAVPLRESLAEAEQRLARAQEEYLLYSRIVSPLDGRVLEVRKKVGDHIAVGESLASLEGIRDDRHALEAVLFIPAAEGQEILPGMDVQISPAMTQVEEYGYIVGKVVSVSEYPISNQGMLNLLGNDELVRRFASVGAPVEVRVEIETDSQTPSGYRWSAGEGPSNRLQSGTLVSASIVVRSDRPFQLVLPGSAPRS